MAPSLLFYYNHYYFSGCLWGGIEKTRVVDVSALCAVLIRMSLSPQSLFLSLSLCLSPPSLFRFSRSLIKSASLAWLPKIIGVGFGCHLLEMSPFLSFFFFFYVLSKSLVFSVTFPHFPPSLFCSFSRKALTWSYRSLACSSQKSMHTEKMFISCFASSSVSFLNFSECYSWIFMACVACLERYLGHGWEARPWCMIFFPHLFRYDTEGEDEDNAYVLNFFNSSLMANVSAACDHFVLLCILVLKSSDYLNERQIHQGLLYCKEFQVVSE